MRTQAKIITLLTLSLLVSSVAMAKPGKGGRKVDICHWNSKDYRRISVSVNALDAHLAHGDSHVDSVELTRLYTPLVAGPPRDRGRERRGP